MELGMFIALALVMVGAAAWAVLSPKPAEVVWCLGVATLGAAGLVVLIGGYSLAVALVLGTAGLGMGLFCLKAWGTVPTAVFSKETYGLGLAALVVSIAVLAQVDWMVPAAMALHEKAFVAVGTRLISNYLLPLQCMAFVLLAALVGVAVFTRPQAFGWASDKERS